MNQGRPGAMTQPNSSALESQGRSSSTLPLRLAYADPPYPGKAHLYRDHPDYAGEVDHAELFQRLERDYDGWALSTDETNLQSLLTIAPRGVRVLAWCKSDAMPYPPNPWQSWEPVICRPARTAGASVRSYFVGAAPPRGFCASGPTLVGAKTKEFCQWVIRCLGAEDGDTLDDIFPGTGVMGETWEAWRTQPALWSGQESFGGSFNLLRRTHPQLPGMPDPVVKKERAA